MGRTSVSLKVLAAEVGRVQERLHRSADDARTVRKVVPFKELEQRAAERKAAAAPPPWKQSQTQDIEEAPDSGVRMGAENHALSYTVYSVAELEARPRTSAPPPMNAPIPSRWPDVGRSARALMHAWWTYYFRAAKPRPQMMDVCRVPMMTLRVDLFAALRQLPWKKIGIRSGIAFASILALLFTVMTVAELTDDLKPSRTALNKAQLPTAAAAPPPPPVEPAIEIIDEAPPAAATPAKKPVVKAKPPVTVKKKKKGADIFNP